MGVGLKENIDIWGRQKGDKNIGSGERGEER
jgi:hypothetical protein